MIDTLSCVLARLAPVLRDEEYVFVTEPHPGFDFWSLSPFAYVREQEGHSLVLEKQLAMDAGYETKAVYRCISLSVVTELSLVGLTATIAALFKANGISCNVIAAYYHDHLFVSEEQAGQALALLTELADQHRASVADPVQAR